MNIHFPQVERKSQLFSHLLITFAAITVLMLILSMSRQIDLRLSIQSASMQTAHTTLNDGPVPVPAPLPPATQTQAIATPEPTENPSLIFVPQVIPAPAPSMP